MSDPPASIRDPACIKDPASIRTTRFTDEHDIIYNTKILGFIFITAVLLNANHTIRTDDAMHHSATRGAQLVL